MKKYFLILICAFIFIANPAYVARANTSGSTYLLNEDFESYATNKLPNSGWTEIYNGSGNNKISSQKSLSGKKSLFLAGRSNWAAVVGNKSASWPTTAKTVGYELSIYPQTPNIDFGFYDDNPKWGWWYYAVVFNKDGYIYLTGGESDLTGGKKNYTKICSYDLNKWYKIKVTVNIDSNKCTVYVNGEAKATDIFQSNNNSKYSINDSFFTLCSDNNTNTVAYYDDIKVWYSGTTSSDTVSSNIASSTATSNTSNIDTTGSTYLLNEDFESYATNRLPNSGWTEIYNGSGNNKISSQKSLSGKKSLFLAGRSNWAAVVGNKSASWPTTAKTVGYELSIYPQTPNIDFGFYDDNPKWGWWYYAVVFNKDGYIYLTGGESDLTGGKKNYTKICSYDLNKWYKIKVIVNTDSNKCTVYVNGEAKATDIFQSNNNSKYSINDSFFTLCSDNNTNTAAYYDDIKVWK